MTLPIPLSRLRWGVLFLAWWGTAACETNPPPATVGGADTVAATPTTPVVYTHELLFVGEIADTPLVAPFLFRTTDLGAEHRRSAQAWLGLGGTWDAFLDERWTAPAGGSVWQILPHGELRITAGEAGEIDGIVFQRETRRLRMQLGKSSPGWIAAERARYRVRESEIQLGDRIVPGGVLEVQRLVRERSGERGATDVVFLFGDRSLRLLIVNSATDTSENDSSLGWTSTAAAEEVWDQAHARGIEVRSVEPARRDIPLRWSYAIPGAGIRGEVAALGYEVVLGEEEGERREVEVWYSVEGNAEVDGETRRVFGTVYHEQR